MKKTNKRGGGPMITQGIEWNVIGVPGNNSLEIRLKKGQSVVADGGVMVHMDGGLAVETRMSSKGSDKGFFSSLGSAVRRSVAGESFFMNYYTGTGDVGTQHITFGVPLPGDFVMIELAPNDGWKMSKGAFIVGSDNLHVGGKLNLKGILPVGQDEGIVLTYAISKEAPGAVWIAAYGNIQKHLLKAGDKLVVNNEHFLACKADVEYKLVRVGKNMKSLFFSGEGFAMQFTGPCELYTQSKGILRLARELQPYLPGRGGGQGSAAAIQLFASNSGGNSSGGAGPESGTTRKRSI